MFLISSSNNKRSRNVDCVAGLALTPLKFITSDWSQIVENKLVICCVIVGCCWLLVNVLRSVEIVLKVFLICLLTSDNQTTSFPQGLVF